MSRNRQTPTPTTPSGSHVLEVAADESAAQFPRILRLRGEDSSSVSSSRNSDEDPSNRRIRWSEDVVDNEGMGKKKSKVCCIYHKPRPVGESSSESESDSSSSDSDSDSETDQPRGSSRHPHQHNARSNRDDDQTPGRGRDTCCAKHHSKEGKRRKPSPNAYEKMPTSNKNYTKSQGS